MKNLNEKIKNLSIALRTNLLRRKQSKKSKISVQSSYTINT